MDFSKFAKLDENGQIVYPPHNDGNKINVHHNAEWLAAHGFEEHDQAWFDEHTLPPPEPPPRASFTRLEIRRAMRALGIESKLDAVLSASEVFRNDWNDTTDIKLGDPILTAALETGIITEAEIAAIQKAASK